jgi:hypothetical protein
MPTIKASWKEMRAHGIQPSDLIRVQDLGRFGFNDEILAGMQRFQIFPQALFVAGVVYVKRESIFLVVEKLLQNAIRLYEGVEETEKKAAEAQRVLEEESVPLTNADFQRFEAGEAAMVDIISEKLAAKKEEASVGD